MTEADTAYWEAPKEFNPLSVIISTETGGAAVTYGSEPGRKTSDTPNEDSYSAQKVTFIPDADPAQQLHRVVQHVVDKNAARRDGSTLTSALVLDGHLYASHLGDSPVLVITYDPANKDKPVTVRQVTRDHQGKDPEEVKLLPDPSRIDPGNGRLYQTSDIDRDHGYMLTRAGGMAGWPLNRQAEDTHVDLNPELAGGKKVYVAVGSDGIMESAPVDKIEKMLNIIFKFALEEEKRLPTEKEIALALTRHRYSQSKNDVEQHPRNDDATVIVQQAEAAPAAPPPGGRRTGALLTVADGNNYQFENDQDIFVLDEQNRRKPLYEKQLSKVLVEEVGRFMQSPGLVSSAAIGKQA